MPQASSYPAVKHALVARLRTRPALTNVNVLDRVPVNMDDIKTDAGTNEAIWVGGATAVSADVVFCAGNLRFDENPVELTIGIEVYGTDSEDTQPAMDVRANELLYEVLAEVANQGDWDLDALGLDHFDYVYFTPSTYEWSEGRLQQTGVFGAAVEMTLGINARLNPT